MLYCFIALLKQLLTKIPSHAKLILLKNPPSKSNWFARMNQSFKFYPKPGGVKATALVVFFLLLISGLPNPVLARDAGQISGRVYSDLNINNISDIGEQGLFGWQVNLLLAEKIIKSTPSDSSGHYYFPDLPPGDYQIQAGVQNGWAMVFGRSAAINLRAGQQAEVNLGGYQINQIDEKTFSPLMYIHTYSVQKLSPTSVKVIWFTNYLATGQIVFGKNQVSNPDQEIGVDNFGYQNATAVDFEVKTYHEIILENIEPGKVYFSRIISLPDPRQWRGAPGIVSPEIIITAGSFGSKTEGSQTGGDSGGQVKGSQTQDSNQTPDGKGNLIHPGKVLSTEISEEEIADEEEAKIEADAAKQQAKEEENKAQPAQCAYYIWLFLILNLIGAALAWQRGKNSESNLIKNMWWILSLLALGPTIFYYPSCRTAVWLLVLLAVNFSYVSGFKKKPRPPGEASPPPPSPFDNFDDDNITASG